MIGGVLITLGSNIIRVWDVDSRGTLEAASYPRNRALEGGLVPSQEAAITIFMNGGETGTIETWIKASLEYVEEVRRRKVILQPGQHGDVDSYVEVESRYNTGPGVYYRRVTAYYALDGRIFAAQLEFREGARGEASYRSALDGVIRSIVELK